MPDYKKMYYELFRASEEAIRVLTEAQQRCEELYVSSEDTIVLLPKEPK